MNLLWPDWVEEVFCLDTSTHLIPDTRCPFLGHSRQIHWRRMSQRVGRPSPSSRSKRVHFHRRTPVSRAGILCAVVIRERGSCSEPKRVRGPRQRIVDTDAEMSRIRPRRREIRSAQHGLWMNLLGQKGLGRFFYLSLVVGPKKACILLREFT
jgi:hypothetical protein